MKYYFKIFYNSNLDNLNLEVFNQQVFITYFQVDSKDYFFVVSTK